MGTDILNLAMDQMLMDGATSAARIAVVDADNEEAVIRFHERNVFFTSLFSYIHSTYQDSKTEAAPPSPCCETFLVHCDLKR